VSGEEKKVGGGIPILIVRFLQELFRHKGTKAQRNAKGFPSRPFVPARLKPFGRAFAPLWRKNNKEN
jgi:hypothetical protein